MADSVADDLIRSFYERWQRLEEEKDAISGDLRELFAEAKGVGFDTKVLRAVFRDRTKDQTERNEFEAVYDLYWSALGMPIATGAHPAQGGNSSTAARKDVLTNRPGRAGSTPASSTTAGDMGESEARPVAGIEPRPSKTIPGNGAGGAEDETLVATSAPSSAQPIPEQPLLAPSDPQRSVLATREDAKAVAQDTHSEPEAMGLTSPAASVSGDEGTVLPAAALVATQSNVTTLRTHNPATHFLNSTGLVRLHGCLKPELCGAAEPRKKLCFGCSVQHDGPSSQTEGGAA